MDNSEEENRRNLCEYISHIYGEPAYTEKSEVEAKWAGLFVRRDDRYRPECIGCQRLPQSPCSMYITNLLKLVIGKSSQNL